MSDTYEENNITAPTETYEWDNTWYEHTQDTVTPRILYIGDSISRGTYRKITEYAQGKYYCDSLSTSKALDNPHFFNTVRLFHAQQNRCDAVIFNNGLHGWHLNDDTEYPLRYEEAIRFFLSEYKNTPLLLALTTTVANPEREKRVCTRNDAVKKLAAQYGLPIIDLYDVSTKNKQNQGSDGVHFTPSGYELLARTICESIAKIL